MQSPIHLLHRAGQAAGALFQQDVPGSVTPRQFATLAAIASNEGTSQTGLVAATGIDRSTLSDVVRRLGRQGYVQRRRSRDDNRAWVVSLTDAGRDLLRISGPKVARTEQKILACLPHSRRATFLESLRLISTALERR